MDNERLVNLLADKYARFHELVCSTIDEANYVHERIDEGLTHQRVITDIISKLVDVYPGAKMFDTVIVVDVFEEPIYLIDIWRVGKRSAVNIFYGTPKQLKIHNTILGTTCTVVTELRKFGFPFSDRLSLLYSFRKYFKRLPNFKELCEDVPLVKGIFDLFDEAPLRLVNVFEELSEKDLRSFVPVNLLVNRIMELITPKAPIITITTSKDGSEMYVDAWKPGTTYTVEIARYLRRVMSARYMYGAKHLSVFNVRVGDFVDIVNHAISIYTYYFIISTKLGKVMKIW